ncbi:SDR family NAD(P)-dependent oxidoreductase [Streptomyces sp. E11-3]|uniref:SDR family NAD(P)-dependent oxidoreductase n=1 Tax=Streptomyces sp. E11-3 TaxID=3110112 RepID=UPI0039817218
MSATKSRMAGKSCLVTGAASGIGRATAKVLVREGGAVVAMDRNEPRLINLKEELDNQGLKISVVSGDVSKVSDVQHAILTATKLGGRLDVLVANAGIIPLTGISESTPEEWERVMAIDGKGMFLCCKYAIEEMRKSGGGAIVCTSSVSGVAGQRNQVVYGPAKFVASGLTKHLAVECAGEGIRVNAVAPGTIMTERVRELRDSPGGDAYIASMVRVHPIGRLGEPREVAAAIAFLASDEASFITGVVLPVDGGYLAQ